MAVEGGEERRRGDDEGGELKGRGDDRGERRGEAEMAVERERDRD